MPYVPMMSQAAVTAAARREKAMAEAQAARLQTESLTLEEKRRQTAREYAEMMKTQPPMASSKHFKFNQLSAGRSFKWEMSVEKKDKEEDQMIPMNDNPEERLMAQGLGYGSMHRHHFLYTSQDRPPRRTKQQRVEALRKQKEWEAGLLARAMQNLQDVNLSQTVA